MLKKELVNRKAGRT